MTKVTVTDFYLHTGNENEENSKCQLNLHVYIHSWNTRKSEFSGKYNNSKFRNTPKARKRVTVKDTFSQISAAIKNAEHSGKKKLRNNKTPQNKLGLTLQKKKPVISSQLPIGRRYYDMLLWYTFRFPGNETFLHISGHFLCWPSIFMIRDPTILSVKRKICNVECVLTTWIGHRVTSPVWFTGK